MKALRLTPKGGFSTLASFTLEEIYAKALDNDGIGRVGGRGFCPKQNR